MNSSPPDQPSRCQWSEAIIIGVALVLCCANCLAMFFLSRDIATTLNDIREESRRARIVHIALEKKVGDLP